MKYLSITQRLSFVVVLLFQVLLLQAEGLIREVTVTEAGTLSTLIPASEKMEITDLKVSGSINGADIKYICEMAGMADKTWNKNAKLYNLDLKDANIVDGGLEGTEWVSQKDALGYDNYIGQAAFHGCYSLRKIAFPSTLSQLKYGALDSCPNLSNVVISSSEISCREMSIFNCNIDTLSFLSSEKMIVRGVNFLSATSLNAVKIDVAELELSSEWGWGNNTLKSVSIKTSGNATLSGFFSGCKSLTSLSINVGGILGDGSDSSDRTFSGCTSLETFELKATGAILNGTFNGCVNLKSFNIDVSEFLELSGTFARCSSLESVDFGSNKVGLRSTVFQGCNNLQRVKGKLYLGKSLFGDDLGAFGNCPRLKSVEGLRGHIVPYAFDGCTSLDSIVIEDTDFSTVFFRKNSAKIFRIA